MQVLVLLTDFVFNKHEIKKILIFIYYLNLFVLWTSHYLIPLWYIHNSQGFSIGQWVFGAFLPLPDSTVKMKREDAQWGALGQNQTRVTAACGRLLNPWAKLATYCVFTQTVLNLSITFVILCAMTCDGSWATGAFAL